MAKSKGSDNPSQQTHVRSFKPDTSRFRTLQPGEEFTGVFVGAGHTEIRDKRTRALKTLFVLRIRDEETDKVEKFPCAAMMLRAWEDICDEYGNGDTDATIQQLRNRRMTISRGENMKTADSNPMGSYEFQIFEE